MSDEKIEQPATEKTGPDARKEAIEGYQSAYLDTLKMRADFSHKRGYRREKQPDEQAFHKVKPIFGGEFRPTDRKIMEKNTNDGKGVDVALPDGSKVHIANQAELFDQIVEFNKERGEFYDISKIAKLNPNDHKRLETVNGDLAAAKKAVLNSFDKRGFGFRRLAAIESKIKTEFESQKTGKTAKNTPVSDQSKMSSISKTERNAKETSIPETASPERNDSSASANEALTGDDKAAFSASDAAAQANVELKEIPINEFAVNESTPIDWVKAQNEKTASNMRHMMVLSYLQEQQYSAEREHFYNEVYKQFGHSIDSVADAEQYIAKLMVKDSEAMLRDTAPGAVAATQEYINSMDTDKALRDAGYPQDRVTTEFRKKMQITHAYANRIGGKEGNRSFLQSLGEQKDNFLKGLGDPRVGLAISGSLLAMSVMAGTGPAGLVIGSLRVAQKLMDTEKGQAFQKSLYSSATGFMEKLGVKAEVVEAVTESVKNIWSKTVGSRWSKLALYGVGACAVAACAIAGLPPSVMNHIPSIADSSVLSPDAGTAMAPALPTSDVPYDIKSGDKLWGIAKDAYAQAHPGESPNNVQLINMVNEIAEHNDIDNPNMIYSGQTILVPQDLQPSAELVSGPTHWLREHSGNMTDRLDGLDDRAQEWRQNHQPDHQDPRLKGYISV